MRVFLSYAEEDAIVAAEIAGWLKARHAEVYWFQSPAELGRRFASRIEMAMSRADRFLALMSPSFLTSAFCGREGELALHREADLQAVDSAAWFITVLEIVATPRSEAGFLRSYGWLPAFDLAARETALDNVFASLPPPGGAKTPPSEETAPEAWSPIFRNREHELEEVVHGLTNVAGTHFWLVIAPPQLGKTWFIHRLATKVLEELEDEARWAARRVDLKDQPQSGPWDVRLLLEQLFGVRRLADGFSAACLQVAKEIVRRGQPHLCILDSAELLDRESVDTLRAFFGEIYRMVEEAARPDVRLAAVVASRRDDGWQSMRRGPRFSLLPLTEFKSGVVQGALNDLAREMKVTSTSAAMKQNAAVVHDLSEGLPALLVQCLRWIRAEQWIGFERLKNDPELFERLAYPYVREVLLAQESLLGRQPEDGQLAPRQALIDAFRVLAPYRFFTQSHLRHHIESDRALRRAMEDLDWSVEQIWSYLDETAIRARPPVEPWIKTSPPIRRLLYRYFHRSDERRGEVHFQASTFARIWADELTGSDQVAGLIESLWHEAAALYLSQSPELDARLCESARALVVSLRESRSLSVYELRKNAADRLDGDEEFQGLIGSVTGLPDKLRDIIRPAEEA
jgi:hypothetical protein